MSFQRWTAAVRGDIRSARSREEQSRLLRDYSLMVSTATLGLLAVAAWIAMVFGPAF